MPTAHLPGPVLRFAGGGRFGQGHTFNPPAKPNTMNSTSNQAQTTAATGFDLDTIEDVSQADVELMHPTKGTGTGAFITLMGPEHPERKAITLGLMRRARAEAMRSNSKPKDPEEDIAESIDMLVKITVGWRGIAQNGQPVPFSPAAAAALYGDKKRQWVVKQLIGAMNDNVLFIKA